MRGGSGDQPGLVPVSSRVTNRTGRGASRAVPGKGPSLLAAGLPSGQRPAPEPSGLFASALGAGGAAVASRRAWRYHGSVTWDQVGTIVVTVVLAVLAGIVYNNRRFDDVNRRFDDVHRRIDDLRADMNARFAQVDARFAQVDARLGELREDLREIRGLLQEALRARAS